MLLWDGSANLDLHAWDPSLAHVYRSHPTAVTGALEVDACTAGGPECFSAAGSATGRYRLAVNAFDVAAARRATLQIIVNRGSNAGCYTFGPYQFTTGNSMGGLPIAGNTASWWRPCDIYVTDTTVAVQTPDTTALGL